MAAWTDLTFIALEVLAAAKLNQVQANFTALVQAAGGIPTWTKATIVPSGVDVALTITQGYNANCLVITNAGNQNDIIVGAFFTLKNGYIAPGGQEALRWDIISVDLDGVTTDVDNYTINRANVRVLITCAYDVSGDRIDFYTDHAVDTYNDCKLYDDAGQGKYSVDYGGFYAEHDFVHIFIGYVAA